MTTKLEPTLYQHAERAWRAKGELLRLGASEPDNDPMMIKEDPWATFRTVIRPLPKDQYSSLMGRGLSPADVLARLRMISQGAEGEEPEGDEPGDF